MKQRKDVLTKPEKMYRIALDIFSLEASHGHLKWKVSDLARKSEVSRQLIYRYFGSSKKDLLTSALNVFCHEFYGFAEAANGKEFATAIRDARSQMENNYQAILFYQKWRARDSFLKTEFIRIEGKFRKKLKKLFPQFTQEQIILAHACIHGLVTSPFLSADEAAQACMQLHRSGVFK